MNFVADQSVPRPRYERLRSEGHFVLAIAEHSPGIADPEVLNLATQQRAVLLTADKDFGELVFRQGQASTGVILVRLSGLTSERKALVLSTAIQTHGDEMPEAFSVVFPTVVRIRHRRGAH